MSQDDAVWLGKLIEQFRSVRDGTIMQGQSKVIETMIDEKGSLHLKTENGWWSPAWCMRVVE